MGQRPILQNRTDMKEKLQQELIQLASRIAGSRDLNITEMYGHAQKLYEKLAVLKVIEEKLNHIEVDVSRNELAARFEKLAGAIMKTGSEVPETNPHQEDIITPGMDTIRHLVSEMYSDVAMDQLFIDLLEKGDLTGGKPTPNGSGH